MRDDGDEHASARALPITSEQLLAEIEAKVSDGRLLKQGSLEVTKLDPDDVRLTYTRSSPTPRMTATEAEVATIGIVKLTVDVLIAHGWNSRERETAIFAHAYQPAGKSVTGAVQVRTFGKAAYDFGSDRVTFQSAE